MISIKNVSKKYNEQVIFDNLNLVFDNSIYLIKGSNGSGKTTLFNILTKNTDYEGEIFIDDIELREIDKDELRTNYITYVSQDIKLLFNKKVMDNVELFSKSKSKSHTSELISILGLNDVFAKNNLVKKLSGGEQKKLQIFIGLLSDNPILILDEFDNHIDKRSRTNLINYITTIDKTVLVVSHTLAKESELSSNVKVIDLQTKIEQTSDFTNEKLTVPNFKFKYNRKLTTKSLYSTAIYVVTFSIILLSFFSNLNVIALLNTFEMTPSVYGSDNAMIIKPPKENNYYTVYANDDWHKVTPLDFTDEDLEKLKDNPLVSHVEMLPTEGFFSIYKTPENKYYITDDRDGIFTENSRYNYRVSTNVTGGDMPDLNGFKGAFPHDDSNEVYVSETYLENNNNKIGDVITLDMYEVINPGMNSHVATTSTPIEFKIVGSNQNYYDENQVNFSFNSEHQNEPINTLDVDILSGVSENVDISQFIDEYDESKNYYAGFYIETKNTQDLEKLTYEIYDYDPYIEQISVYSDEISQYNFYIKDYIKQFIINTSTFLIIGALIICLIYFLSIRKVVNKTASILYFYGYNKKIINKTYLIYNLKIITFTIIMSGIYLLFVKLLDFTSILGYITKELVVFNVAIIIFITLVSLLGRKYEN